MAQNHDLIKIKRTVKRRRLKSSTKDYLDEYTLTDKATKTVLWYAHFHYPTPESSFGRFLSARLKTPQERELGSAADHASGLTTEQRIAFYRSGISLTQAQQLFFPDTLD